MTEQPTPRRTRSALRRLLIDAGVDLLLEEGLGPAGDNVTFQRAFDRLEETAGVHVTHASVLGRIWESQRHYRQDVLAALADDDGSEVRERTVEAVAAVVAAADLSSMAGRRAAVREACRVGCEVELATDRASPRWRARTAVWAVEASRGTPDEDAVVRASLEQARARLFDGYVDLYRELLDVFGFRMRPPFTVSEMVRMAAALSEGCALRGLVGVGPFEGVLRPTGPDGELQAWTLFGIGLDAMIDTFAEPRPGWTPS